MPFLTRAIAQKHFSIHTLIKNISIIRRLCNHGTFPLHENITCDVLLHSMALIGSKGSSKNNLAPLENERHWEYLRMEAATQCRCVNFLIYSFIDLLAELHDVDNCKLQIIKTDLRCGLG